MLLQSRKSGIAPIVMPTVAITGPTIDRITTPTTATMVGPTIIGPTTTIQGGAEASMQLNSCCNASLPNPSCLAGERRLAVDDDLALLRQECSAQMSHVTQSGAPKNLEASGFLSPGLPTLIFDLSNFSDLSNFRPRE